MKNQALFSSKDKSKKKKKSRHLLQFLFGALRVNKIVKNIKYTIFANQIAHLK